MMRVVTPAPRAEWSTLCRADRHAVLCQSPGWTDAICSRGAYEDASRLYVTPAGTTIVLPLVRRRGPVPAAWRTLASMPDAWGMGGLLSAQPLAAADVAAIGRDLAQLPAARVAVRPNPLQSHLWEGAGGTVVPRRAHVLDLTGGPDAVWERRFKSSARRAVRKAQRAGLELRCGSGPDLLRDYRRLFDLSVRRWAADQHEPVALARLRAHRRDPASKFARLTAEFPDLVRIWIAYDNGIPVAGIIVLLASVASYTRGAMDRSRITASSANELLHWHAIQEACAAGCSAYHLGESGSSESLARFKEKLGAEPVDYAERRFERLPLTRTDVAARSAVKTLIGFRDA